MRQDECPQFEALESRFLLSAVLPAPGTVNGPVVVPDAPAEWDVFEPTLDANPPSGLAPIIAEYTRTAGPDESIVLTADQLSRFSGLDYGRDTQFWVYGQTDAGDAVLAQAAIQTLDGYTAILTLPDDLPPWSAYLLWAENNQGAGEPVVLNQAETWWVGPEFASAGSVISVYGRNLANANGTSDSWVYLAPIDTGSDVGNAATNRGSIGSGANGFYTWLVEPLPQGQQVTSFTFYNDDPTRVGEKITPILFEETSPGNLVIRGVGTTRTNTGAGEQTYSFGLVSGTATAGTGRFYFGWRDGGTTSSDMDVPVVPYSGWTTGSVNAASAAYGYRGAATVGQTMKQSAGQQYRAYSIHCTMGGAVSRPEATFAEVVAVDPYRVDFVIPENFAEGSYQLYVHNGHGAEYGWSAPLTFRVVADEEWTGGVYDVTAYGAAGDGITDDTAAIDAAIAAAASDPRSTVYFPAGAYMVSDGFSAPSNFRWLGDGKDATFIRCASNFDAADYFWIGGGTDGQAEALTLSTNHNYSMAMLIYQRGARNMRYQDMRIDAHSYDGFDLHSSRNIYFQNVDVIQVNSFEGTGSQLFFDHVNFYCTKDSNTPLYCWGGSQISMSYSTLQDYDNTQTDGWGQGRWFTGAGLWGTVHDIYLGNNTSNDMGVRPGFWNQNTGEQFMFEGDPHYYDGYAVSATTTTLVMGEDFGGTSSAQRLTVTGGKGLGQSREILSYDAETHTVTIKGEWNVLPDATSIVSFMMTIDRVAIFDNYLDGKDYVPLQNDHIASSGVQPFEGGLNFIVDRNTFHQIRNGISLWGVSDDGTDNKPVNFGLYANNTFEENRWGVRFIGQHPDLGAEIFGNVFRGNVMDGIIYEAFGFTAGTGTNSYPWVAANVIEHTTAVNIGQGVVFSGPGNAFADNLLYRNSFVRGTPPVGDPPSAAAGTAGITFVVGQDPLLRENTWTGFSPVYSGSLPGPKTELPWRVFEMTVESGLSTGADLTIWNSGTGALNWSASDTAGWLVLSAGSGSVANENATSTLGLTANAAGLLPGEYEAVVTVTAGGQTRRALVVLHVTPSSADAPQVVEVRVNGQPRGLSGIDPSGRGVRTISVRFSQTVTFDPSAVTVQKVAFPGGQQTLGDTLTPVSVQGSGTDTMTITLAEGDAMDTWLKIVLIDTAVVSLVGLPLDGEAPVGGSGPNYLYDDSTDLPSGDGLAGGDGVFLLGSLAGDFDADRTLGAGDFGAFLTAWQAASPDADFRGPGFSAAGPDGLLTPSDIDGFSAVWQQGQATGVALDALPATLPIPAEPIVIFNGDRFTVELVYEGPVGESEDLMAMTLRVNAKYGGNANAFFGMISGELHQDQPYYLGGLHATATDEAWSGDVPSDLDSYFLLDGQSVVSVNPPTEDLWTTASSEVSMYEEWGYLCGFGDTISGDFALAGYMESSWDFVRLVAPIGSVLDLDFGVGGILGEDSVDMQVTVGS